MRSDIHTSSFAKAVIGRLTALAVLLAPVRSAFLAVHKRQSNRRNEAPDASARLANTSAGPALVRATCHETTLLLNVSGFEGEFGLPVGQVGETFHRPCAFRNKTYEDGKMSFQCRRSGHWTLAESTCTDCVSAGCPSTAFNLTKSGHNGTFMLPCGSPDAVLRQPCAFEDKRYENGSIGFACKRGRWEVAEETCATPLSAGCHAGPYTVFVSGHKAVKELPSGRAGDHLEAPCVFQDKAYVDGGVRFYCADKAWQFLGNSCSDCIMGGCEQRNFKVNISGHEADFKLPCGRMDQHLAIPCVFRDKSYLFGFVNFGCKLRSWTIENSTCHDY